MSAVTKRQASDSAPSISKGEREDLLRLIKQREKAQKSAAAMRSAELLADFEQQMSAIYKFDKDPVWAKAVAGAEAEVAKAQTAIAKRCKQLGIPDDFAPGLTVQWHGRGENAVQQRRAELRIAAKRRVEAIEQAACVEIEMASVKAQTQLLTHGLTSATAHAFLEQMPSIETLMPKLEAKMVEALMDQTKRKRRDDYA